MSGELQRGFQGSNEVSRDRNRPPTEWASDECTVIDAEVGIYAMPAPDGSPNPTIWHWCTSSQRWHAQGTRNHTMHSAEPLHLEPSCLWDCCGLHGWIRDGKWVSA